MVLLQTTAQESLCRRHHSPETLYATSRQCRLCWVQGSLRPIQLHQDNSRCRHHLEDNCGELVVEAGPQAPFNTDWTKYGGGAGIWQSGLGLASDGPRIFFVTGSGQGHEDQGLSATGQSGCRTLGESAINLNIATGGKLQVQDYYTPYLSLPVILMLNLPFHTLAPLNPLFFCPRPTSVPFKTAMERTMC